MKLEADFEDFEKAPHSARIALSCALSAYHLHEWVWGDWLKSNSALQRALGIESRASKDRRLGFLKFIEGACPWFLTIQEIATGAKHFCRPSFETLQVGAVPFIFDIPNAGFDEGAFDGPLPYDRDMAYNGRLLLDYGPGADSHRYYPVLTIFDAVVRFWREFFARYHPDLDVRERIRDWRL
jgi:hypothetical protein